MEDIFVIKHVKELCKQRGWTYYRLAKESGIPHSSLNTMINKQHIPSMSNLIKICQGFDITLAQFFAGMEPITDEQTYLLNLWNMLDQPSKDLVMAYLHGLAHKQIPSHIPTINNYEDIPLDNK